MVRQCASGRSVRKRTRKGLLPRDFKSGTHRQQLNAKGEHERMLALSRKGISDNYNRRASIPEPIARMVESRGARGPPIFFLIWPSDTVPPGVASDAKKRDDIGIAGSPVTGRICTLASHARRRSALTLLAWRQHSVEIWPPLLGVRFRTYRPEAHRRTIKDF